MQKRVVLLASFLFLLSACSPRPVPPVSTLPPPQVVVVTNTPPPTETALPTPTQTVEQAIYPYTIEGLRRHDFQGGDIRIREKLEETAVFTRYLFDYPSDGLTITGIMQVPVEGHAPFPVIVMNHGYFYRGDYASGDGADRAAEYLNRHGYLTLSSDYRSWGGSDAGPSLFYSGLAIDVINLLDAVPSIPQADPDRLGMWGHSMGGGVTVKVLTIDGGRVALEGRIAQSPKGETRVKAAVLYSTVSADDADVIARWGAGCIGDVQENELLYGCNSSDVVTLDLPPGLIGAYRQAAYDPDLLHQISSIYHLEYISAPVQIAYGTNDGKTLSGAPPEWSKKLYQAFKAAGKEAELFAYEDERHSFIGNEWVAFMERSAHFFDKYVKNAQK